jgi:hypothetical protein
MSRAILFSFLLPLLALAQQSKPSELPPAQYNGGDDNPSDPSDAGAAGAQKGAFTLSTGALAAIIVVAVIVVIGGSTLLNLLGRSLLTPSSWLSDSLVACEEATMGRATIAASCITPTHWPRQHRQQAESSEP